MFQERVNLIIKKNDPFFVIYDKEFLTKNESDTFFKLFEKEIKYNSDEMSQVIIAGKKMSISRKQVAFGDAGTYYNFSGNVVNALDWNQNNELCNTIKFIRNRVAMLFNFEPNFVLINRYANGTIILVIILMMKII